MNNDLKKNAKYFWSYFVWISYDNFTLHALFKWEIISCPESTFTFLVKKLNKKKHLLSNHNLVLRREFCFKKLFDFVMNGKSGRTEKIIYNFSYFDCATQKSVWIPRTHIIKTEGLPFEKLFTALSNSFKSSSLKSVRAARLSLSSGSSFTVTKRE